MMRIYLEENNSMYDITSTTGNLTRSDSIDSLGEQMEFSYVGDKIPMGSHIAVYDGSLLYYGMVVQGSRNGVTYHEIRCIVAR